MFLRIFLLCVLVLFSFIGCQDNFEHRELQKCSGKLAHFSMLTNMPLVTDEMDISMYIVQENVIKGYERFSSLNELNASELLLEPGAEYRLLIIARENDAYGYPIEISLGDTVDFDKTVLFSLKDTTYALSKPLYYGASASFDASTGLQESIELKPVVAELNFNVNSRYLDFSGKLWGGKGVYLNGKPTEERSLFNMYMVKEEGYKGESYSKTFYVVGDNQEKKNEICYDLSENKFEVGVGSYVGYQEGLVNEIEPLKAGYVYDYYVNERLYYAQTGAAFVVKVYEPIEHLNSMKGKVVMECRGEEIEQEISVDMGSYGFSFGCSFGDYPRGIYTFKKIVLMDDSGNEFKNLDLSYTLKFGSDGFERNILNIDTISWYFSDPLVNGDGTKENPYIVDTPEKFDVIRYITTSERKYFKQVCDLDFAAICSEGGSCYNGGKGWQGMGEAGSNPLYDYVRGFSGYYDGGGFRIKGLKGGALFNYVVGGEVRNLIMDASCEIKEDAALANNSEGGTIINCVNYATFPGKAGLIGASRNGKVLYCKNYGNIGNDEREGAGGIVGTGLARDTIIGCVNEGKIRARLYAGGILAFTGVYMTGGGNGVPVESVGYAGLLDSCQNRGSVSGQKYVGGISGLGGYISNSRNEAEIVSTATVSHLDSVSCVGGIMGRAHQYCAVLKSENIGKVSGSKYVGGIVGGYYWDDWRATLETISECRNSGAVVGHRFVGGVAGYLRSDVIDKSSNTGSVAGLLDYGNIVGKIEEQE